MGRDLLLDNGVGSLLAGSFGADMAQFWSHRMDQVTEISNQSSEYRHAQTTFDAAIRKLGKIKECAAIALEIEEAFTEMDCKTRGLYYRAGYQDGVKAILQPLL